MKLALVTSTSALVLASVLVAACSSSSSTPERTDAAPEDAVAHDATRDAKTKDALPSHEASDDSGATEAAVDAADAGSDDAGEGGGTIHEGGTDAPPTPVFSADAGTTWTALYRDYFGNDSQSNTAGCSNGDCHGSTSGSGYLGSSFNGDGPGYLCPKGDKETCWKSITSQVDGGPELITPDASFTDDYLYMALCKVDDAGVPIEGVIPSNMPQGCVYNFTPTDLERIRTWVESGYPDN